MNTKVEEYISNAKKWKPELETLRSIILECGLEEDYKWRNPCYTFEGSNIVIIGELKDSCILSFFKGVLLQDAHHILVKAGENSHHAMMVKFTNVQDINNQKEILQAYIYEAIEVEKAGIKVVVDQSDFLKFPQELIDIMEKDAKFKDAFTSLTPGKQRAYNLYFSDAKQSKTRMDRIEKYTHRILNGKGFHDCVCGLSKRMPNCDGSHKLLEK